jgi:hypothetical protein
MKDQLLCALRKDGVEYMKKRKNILFAATLLFLCLMVYLSTEFLPSLISALMENASHVISDSETLESTLLTFFPKELRANMGILSSDFTTFYGIVIILSTYNLVGKEIRSGKWIFPLSVGYDPFVLIFSKGIVYGLGAALPATVFYNLYFFLGSTSLTVDYACTTALVNSVTLGFACFSIVYLTIMLSSIDRQPFMAAATMILFIVLAPDIFSLFSFGAYLPTHILTHLYRSDDQWTGLIVPILTTLLAEVVLTVIAAKKSLRIEAAR